MSECVPPRDAEPIWGAAAIGVVIDKNPRQTFYLLQNGMLPARKVGNRWVSERQALVDFLRHPGARMAA